jgi:hypothetical protein
LEGNDDSFHRGSDRDLSRAALNDPGQRGNPIEEGLRVTALRCGAAFPRIWVSGRFPSASAAKLRLTAPAGRAEPALE